MRVRLAPQVRMVAATSLCGSCLIVAPSSLVGGVFITLTPIVWMVLCHSRLRFVASVVLVSTLVFLPVAFLAGYSAAAGGASSTRIASAVWDLLSRGFSVILISSSTIRVLPESDFQRGVSALPFPEAARLLLVQIVHQTATLVEESRRISHALVLRGGVRGGFASWAVIQALPRIWLPRIIVRAERVAGVMELRGYDRLPRSHGEGLQMPDIVTLAASAGCLLGSIVHRLVGAR
jgi:hypothetical protein